MHVSPRVDLFSVDTAETTVKPDSEEDDDIPELPVIVGASVGGVGLIGLIVGLVISCQRRSEPQPKFDMQMSSMSMSDFGGGSVASFGRLH